MDQNNTQLNNRSTLNEIKDLILSICDLPDPLVYLKRGDDIKLLYGLNALPEDLILISSIAENKSTELQIELPDLPQHSTYHFILCLPIGENEQMVVLDEQFKELSSLQVNSLNHLKNYYTAKINFNRQSSEIQRYSEGIRLINALSIDSLTSVEDKFHRCLSIATQYFGFETGIISKIEDSSFQIMYSYSKNPKFYTDETYHLKDTYASFTLNSKGTFAVCSMSESGYEHHPAYKRFQHESYIGTLFSTNNVSGTIAFCSKKKKTNAFSAFDYDFIELIARWVESTFKQAEKEELLRSERNMLSSFVNYAPASIAMFDRDMKYIAASSQWIKMYEIQRNVIGLSHYTVFPEISAEWKAYHKKALSGETIRKEEDEFKLKDGSSKYIQWIIKPWYNKHNQIGGLLIFTNDLSSLVKQRLEVEEAKLLSDRAVKIKEQFAYVASHDLKEPVRTINSISSLLRKNYINQVDNKGQKLISYLEGSSQRMINLVDGLLEYSQLDSIPQLAPIDLNQLLNEVLTDLFSLISEQRPFIHVSKLPSIIGFPTEMRLIFQNLIQNAIKFKDQSRPTLIEIDFEELEDHWKFQVNDNGIGVPDKLKEKIFLLYRQGNKREKFNGYGIGLANCQRIAELHKGGIWVEDNKPHGSKFIFTVSKRL